MIDLAELLIDIASYLVMLACGAGLCVGVAAGHGYLTGPRGPLAAAQGTAGGVLVWLSILLGLGWVLTGGDLGAEFTQRCLVHIFFYAAASGLGAGLGALLKQGRLLPALGAASATGLALYYSFIF